MWVDKEEREDGFSLVELLVVIVIIGILSAIAVGAFLKQRQKANDAVVQAEMRQAINTLETMMVDHPNAVRYMVSTHFEMREGGTSYGSRQPLHDMEGWATSTNKTGEISFVLYSIPWGQTGYLSKSAVLAEEKFSVIDEKGDRTDSGVNVISIDRDLTDGYVLAAYHTNADKYSINEKDLENSESTKNLLAFIQEMEEKYGKDYSYSNDFTTEEQEIYDSLASEYLETYRTIEKVLVYDSTTGKSEEMLYSEAVQKYKDT